VVVRKALNSERRQAVSPSRARPGLAGPARFGKTSDAALECDWASKGVPNSRSTEKAVRPAQIVTAVAARLNESLGAENG
jgi:hypothetical protein